MRERKPRWNKRLEVLIRCSGEKVGGYISNLSDEGMEVRVPYRFSMNDEVTVRVLTSDDDSYHYLSEVRWWRPAIGSKLAKGLYRFGLKHLALDPNHDELMEQIKEQPVRVAQKPRIDFQTPIGMDERFVLEEKVYSENISEEGLFIHMTEMPPPYKDEKIGISFTLPGDKEPFDVMARVVHIVRPHWAEKMDLAPGIGVRFDNLSDEARERLKANLERLAAKAKKNADDR